MGQYYSPILLEKEKPTSKKDIKGWFNSHDHKTKWTRDDGQVFHMGSGLKLMEHSWLENRFVMNVERNLMGNPQRLVWAGDYAEVEEGITVTDDEGKPAQINLSGLCNDSNKLPARVSRIPQYKTRYLVNHSKKEFVDKKKAPKDHEGWRVHPLPILTSEGNGQGGGDYRGQNEKYVGTWARDIISVESEKPDANYKEITPNFME